MGSVINIVPDAFTFFFFRYLSLVSKLRWLQLEAQIIFSNRGRCDIEPFRMWLLDEGASSRPAVTRVATSAPKLVKPV